MYKCPAGFLGSEAQGHQSVSSTEVLKVLSAARALKLSGTCCHSLVGQPLTL